jgi:hypothetical protein
MLGKPEALRRGDPGASLDVSVDFLSHVTENAALSCDLPL